MGNFYEVAFFIDILVHFSLDFMPSVKARYPIKDLSTIIVNYFKTKFIWDLILILPL